MSRRELHCLLCSLHDSDQHRFSWAEKVLRDFCQIPTVFVNAQGQMAGLFGARVMTGGEVSTSGLGETQEARWCLVDHLAHLGVSKLV
jgi:hypothetical protein